MSEQFNKLTPAQAERLALLIEECGEVVQSAGKILRHGYHSFNPDDRDHGGNRADLEKECGDVMAAIELLIHAGDINGERFVRAKQRKLEKVFGYLHHQEARP